MANYQARGTGPVSFVDGNQNQQEIPLTYISFGPNGVDGSAWPNYAANQAVIDALLQQMVAQGWLVQGTPNLTITPAGAGIDCNVITLTFFNSSTTQGTVSMTVSATQIFADLTPDMLSSTVGASASPQSGLVYLQHQTYSPLMPAAFTGATSTSGACQVPAAQPVPGDTSGAFTLVATDLSYTTNITVTVTPTPTSPALFTLTVTVSKTATGVTLNAFQDQTQNPFASLVMFSNVTSVPAPSTVTLNPVPIPG